MYPQEINRTFIRFFEADDFQELENIVNDDIAENKYKIRDIKYHHNMVKNVEGIIVHNCSAMIIYDPAN